MFGLLILIPFSCFLVANSILPIEYRYYCDFILQCILLLCLLYLLERVYIEFSVHFKRWTSSRVGKITTEKEGDDMKESDEVIVYVTDTVQLIEEGGGGKIRPLDGEARDIVYSDRDCAMCFLPVEGRERRIYHKDGIECYKCFSKRRSSKRSLLYLLLREMDIPLDMSNYIFQLYLSFQSESLVFIPSGLPHYKFPPSEYHSLFSDFPTLPIPIYYNNNQTFVFLLDHYRHFIDLYLTPSSSGLFQIIYFQKDGEVEYQMESIKEALEFIHSLVV